MVTGFNVGATMSMKDIALAIEYLREQEFLVNEKDTKNENVPIDNQFNLEDI